MSSEREWLEQFATASPARLVTLLTQATRPQQRALQETLGVARWERLRNLAEQCTDSHRGTTEPCGNVVFIPGFLGSQLSVAHEGHSHPVWLNFFRLATGWLPALRLRSDLRPLDSRFEATATGVINSYYAELILRLASRWNVVTFAYDWRRPLRDSVGELDDFLKRKFNARPVNIVAHSTGGLLARAWLKRLEPTKQRTRVPRLIQLGTPNFGCFETPRLLTGLHQTITTFVDLFAAVGVVRDRNEVRRLVLELFQSFPGTYQFLPCPRSREQAKKYERLFQVDTYLDTEAGRLANPRREFLDLVAPFYRDLGNRFDDEQVVYIAGAQRPTIVDVLPNRSVARKDAYVEDPVGGDGVVPHRLGVPRSVATYYLDESHGGLPTNEAVLRNLDHLLCESPHNLVSLPTSVKELAGAKNTTGGADSAGVTLAPDVVEILGNRLRNLRRRTSKSHDPTATTPSLSAPTIDVTQFLSPPPEVHPAEVHVEALLASAFLGNVPTFGRQASGVLKRSIEAFSKSSRTRAASNDDNIDLSGFDESDVEETALAQNKKRTGSAADQRPRLKLRLLCGAIEQIHLCQWPKSPPIDVLGAGFYLGTRPATALERLDQAITRAMTPAPTVAVRGIFQRLLERGALRAPLGQVFLFPDPRDKAPTGAQARQLALTSMGMPGRFGQPELVIFAREICWTTLSWQRRHMATTLVGAGSNNLSVQEAANGWLRGIARAFENQTSINTTSLRCITFVESAPQRADELRPVLKELIRVMNDRADVPIHFELEDEARTALGVGRFSRGSTGRNKQSRRQDAEEKGSGAVATDPAPVRLSIESRGPYWSLSAMTQSAAVPERVIEVDPALVTLAAKSLAGNDDSMTQRHYGAVLETLLIPKDLRASLYTEAPLVCIVDASTARVPWEMIAEPPEHGLVRTAGELSDVGSSASDMAFDPRDRFLGLTRGLTRQLRSQFGQPPEPFLGEGRALRVLIVADPSEKYPLEGARREGQDLVALFEAFNDLWAHDGTVPPIEVVSLIGADRVDRLRILAEITSNRYDIMHFAGHCFFDADHPDRSGWIFEDGVLSAHELVRLDRIPPFIFSNACESGVTPERAEDFSPALAPSFAESFFRQGVTNFVCTAWPVSDSGSRRFALAFYRALLGMRYQSADDGGSLERAPPTTICQAMRLARQAIVERPYGRGTWGAYQHYGNPFFRLFPELIGQRKRRRKGGRKTRS